MKSEFESARNTKMSEEEYKILLLTYPVFLVAVSDGSFDKEEKELMTNILRNFLQPLYKDGIHGSDYDNLILNYLEDYNFLKNKSQQFKEGLLNELKQFNLEVRTAISELLEDIAKASNGIDELEREVINELNNQYLLVS